MKLVDKSSGVAIWKSRKVRDNLYNRDYGPACICLKYTSYSPPRRDGPSFIYPAPYQLLLLYYGFKGPIHCDQFYRDIYLHLRFKLRASNV